MTADSNTDLVIQGEGDTGLIGAHDMASLLTNRPNSYRCNFADMHRDAFMELMFSAESEDCMKASDNINKTMLVEYWYAHQVQINQRDGNMVDGIRCVLISPDGNCVSAVSIGLASFVARLATFFGQDAIKPPMAVQIRQANVNGGFKMLKFEPLVGKKAPDKKTIDIK